MMEDACRAALLAHDPGFGDYARLEDDALPPPFDLVEGLWGICQADCRLVFHLFAQETPHLQLSHLLLADYM